jgi:hypothetical protein
MSELTVKSPPAPSGSCSGVWLPWRKTTSGFDGASDDG